MSHTFEATKTCYIWSTWNRYMVHWTKHATLSMSQVCCSRNRRHTRCKYGWDFPKTDSLPKHSTIIVSSADSSRHDKYSFNALIKHTNFNIWQCIHQRIHRHTNISKRIVPPSFPKYNLSKETSSATSNTQCNTTKGENYQYNNSDNTHKSVQLQKFDQAELLRGKQVGKHNIPDITQLKTSINKIYRNFHLDDTTYRYNTIISLGHVNKDFLHKPQ